jgi:uncharacterized protein
VSCSVDVNVLLYASDRGSPFSVRAIALLEQRATGSEVFYLAWPTIMSYLRIATHPGIFSTPLSPDEALENIQRLLTRPNVFALSEAEGFWDVYRRVAGSFPVRGNLVPDTHLAALLRQHGVLTLYSNDADFRRFDFLNVVNPFEPDHGP